MKLIPYLVFWGVLAAALIAFAPRDSNLQRALMQSQTNGGPCKGGPPDYCANSTQNVVQETPMAPPPVNTPFRDPDFGSRMVRATDANTLTGVDGRGSQFTATSFMTDASAEANEWGKFDPTLGPNGGYRFLVYTRGGWALVLTLDAATMKVSPLTGKKRGGPLSADGLLSVGGTFSYTDPDTLYFVHERRLEALNLSTGRVTSLYNFESCPSLPSSAGGYSGGVTNSGDDTKFSIYFGGRAQGETTLVAYYDRSANQGAGACYWYDTATGMVGGTNLAPTPVAGGVGQLAPPAAPVVTPQPGSGNLPAGDYYVEITASTQMNPHNGETAPSQEVGPIHLASPGSLVITLPSELADQAEIMVPGGNWGGVPTKGLKGLTPFNVYIGTSRGGETLQNLRGPVGGGNYVQSTPLNTGSRRPPQASIAGYNVHNARLSKDGTYVRIDAQQGYTLYFWKAGTNQITTCTFGHDNCGGHQALGYTHMINDPNDHDFADVLIRPISDLQHYTMLVNPLPTPHQFTGSHWSWNDADPSDTMPVCGSFYGSGGPFRRAYVGEIVCVATSGPSRVWRFAHHRATGSWNRGRNAPSNFWATPRGNVSQDGKFYMFTSDWEGGLGDEQGSHGCPASGRCRTDVFIVELH
jgi:hypothetical protein